MPKSEKVAVAYSQMISKYADVFNINTPLRMAHYLSQVAHESGELTRTSESLSYSSTRLRQVFRKYFPTDTLAKAYQYKPDKIGARVYANRMGNGNEASMDGYTYRGRGLMQITGKANYKALTDGVKKYGINVNFVDQPMLLTNIEYAVISSMWYFDTHKCNAYADADNITAVTKAINGGVNGLAERQRYLGKAKQIITV